MITLLITKFLLSSAGFTLIACFYYLRNNNWNGYANKTKLIVAGAIILIMASLLTFVPDVAVMLKAVTGIDVEDSPAGNITLGIALSALLSSVKPKAAPVEESETRHISFPQTTAMSDRRPVDDEYEPKN